jgi:prepilin-type N-terminal cleavage/methylation domain-containing protein
MGDAMKPDIRRHSGRRRESGMTMIELVIAMVIIGLISVTLIPFFKVSLDSYLKTRLGKNTLQSSRIAFNRMVSELKQIPDPLNVWYGSSTQIQFYIPSNGLLSTTYQLDGGNLERENVKLAESVKSFTLRYYRSNGTQMSVPFAFSSDVWRIEVDMSVGDNSYQLNLKEQISPRNFHVN